MGMFDSVYAGCPKCGKSVEFQSKAGPCVLKNYSAESVPPAIAESLDGDKEYCACGHLLKLKIASPIPRLRMIVVDAEADREWD